MNKPDVGFIAIALYYTVISSFTLIKITAKTDIECATLGGIPSMLSR